MATTTNYGWETPDDTDLVKDGAAAMRTLGNSIDASFVDLKGGTTGQVLSKASNTDLDFTWVTDAAGDITGVTAGTGISGGGTSGTVTVTNSMATAIDAKGDLIGGTGADTFARLAVGANGTVLTADSSEATGLKWAAAAGGGKVLQVVQATTSTSTTVTSTTFTDSGLSATITPSSTSSKILVITSQPIMNYRFFEKSGMQVRLMRGATQAFLQGDITSPAEGAGSGAIQIYGIPTTTGYVFNLTVNSILYLDSPSTTSATTYKTQIGVQSASNSGTVIAQANNSQSSIILMEIGA